MIVGFVTEILPLSVTAFLGCLAFYITGIIDKSAVFSGFSNDIIYMIAGTMIVGEAMFQTGAALLVTQMPGGAVDWVLVGSAALLAGIASLGTSLAGLPELEKQDKEA